MYAFRMVGSKYVTRIYGTNSIQSIVGVLDTGSPYTILRAVDLYNLFTERETIESIMTSLTKDSIITRSFSGDSVRLYPAKIPYIKIGSGVINNFVCFLNDSEHGNNLIGTDFISSCDTISGVCESEIVLSGFNYRKYATKFFNNNPQLRKANVNSIDDIPEIIINIEEVKADPLSELIKSAGMHYNR